jgi:hypothetical protein
MSLKLNQPTHGVVAIHPRKYSGLLNPLRGQAGGRSAALGSVHAVRRLYSWLDH